MEDSGIDSCDAPPDEHLLTSSSESSIEKVRVDWSRRQPAKTRRLTPATRRTEFRPAAESLVPLLRLPIPKMKDNTPLVQWDSDSSDEIGVTFFPSRVADTSLTSRDRASAHGPFTLSDPDGSPDLIVEELTASSSREDDADDLELIVTSPVRGREDTCCCPMLRPCVIF